jgi:hypothetical protein
MNFPSSVWTLILNIKHDPERVKEQIVLRYRQPVYEFVLRRLPNHEDAEDDAGGCSSGSATTRSSRRWIPKRAGSGRSCWR